MPLITFCGPPNSFKTTAANALYKFLTNFINENIENCAVKSVVLINDESLKINKTTGYESALEEKKSRATLVRILNNFYFYFYFNFRWLLLSEF